MLPEGEFVFLDELFNANSAILNNLLTVLNERIYRRGALVHQLPLLSLFAASNHLPDDDALKALFDRFLLRSHVDNLKRDEMPRLLHAGWELERSTPLESSVSARDLRDLGRRVYEIGLDAVIDRYAEIVSKVRDLGVALTDRRAVKVLKLVAASAVLCGRTAALASDFWVFRYVWDREEQIAPLRALVAGVIEPHAHEAASHPLAAVVERIDGEELARELDVMTSEIKNRAPGLAAVARHRERLTDLADRAAWVTDDRARRHLLDRVADLLKILG
jgi:MoxR-like ATPase